jgi:hypothetical protein
MKKKLILFFSPTISIVISFFVFIFVERLTYPLLAACPNVTTTACAAKILINVVIFLLVFLVGNTALNILLLKLARVKKAKLIGVTGVAVSIVVFYAIASPFQASLDSKLRLIIFLMYLSSGISQLLLERHFSKAKV